MDPKDEKKEEFNMLVAMFWPIWAPVIIFIIFLFFKSMY